MSFDFAALERRVAALEASQTTSLRFGRVTSIEGGKARVEMPDGQKTVSFNLSTIQSRILKDQDIKIPDIGEPVACLFSGQGYEQGMVLGAYYNGQENDPGQASHMDYHRYSDGTELWYDREAHQLVGKIKGDCLIETEKTIQARAKEDIYVETQQKATVRAQGEILLESAESVTLKAPLINLHGLLTSTDMDGGPGKGVLNGDFEVLNGGITVPDHDVIAGSVSLRQHVHLGVQQGGGTTDKPVGG